MRRSKSLEELAKDPALLYHAHYLVGTASTVAYWMTMQDDPQVKAMGEKLAAAAGWFFEGKDDKWERPPTYPPASGSSADKTAV